uniref:Vacuolar protein sorting-associated protein 16 homolog n=1 Tax=Mucochytrium quahogii TaxID=96639 RepID=A0A7S2RT75_9STRA|mmetsp:Transcript_34047/g.54469  ORF Transcript_34047/g.54469 Transcript_34047/m.54469 type:complete len:958 (-) Transcript_34047:192-3065(-)|eukprot:CAMPEP_0203755198 /NCGR_PEP_ID=MMETSP0098-20131031/8681_1 /ASSEMBLY_ACC=CAM_ASM_000208 /TAXON_ID=96639 /ORGANISM=" , Strain NY0313808BC1" /LENGTH=957 /DNA_ID=CAMNT_0050646557 /DNA_START=241 /DNA_END=3114 /DNA_ORIENTATION=-
MNDWQKLRDVSYHKWCVYDLSWSVTADDLEDAISAISCFGGPLALMGREYCGGYEHRGSGKMGPCKDAGILYNMVGKKIGVVPYEGIRIAPGGFGWLDFAHGAGAELLVTVYVTGAVHAVTACGDVPSGIRIIQPESRSSLSSMIFNLTEGASFDEFVEHVSVFGAGLAAVLKSGKVVILYAKEGIVWQLNEGQPVKEMQGEQVMCVCVAYDNTKRKNDSENEPMVIISTDSANVYTVTKQGYTVTTAIGKEKEDTQPSPVVKMAISPNGRFVACFNERGWLTVMNIDFSNTVLEFDTRSGVEPLQMCWCGEDSVVMQWKNLGLLMVGPRGDWIKYTYEEPVLIVQEIDSLRIITENYVEVLQRVDKSTETICEIGSFAPSAMLCDAVEAMESGDPKADENLRAIKDEDSLVDAVKECIRAACATFDVSRQQQLLKAASIGKAFCDTNEERRECASAFLLACNALRTLNVIRHESVAFPLTIQQYYNLGSTRLIAKLTARRLHLLALKVCSYQSLPLYCKQYILMDWAGAKLKAPLPVTSVTPALVASKQPVISKKPVESLDRRYSALATALTARSDSPSDNRPASETQEKNLTQMIQNRLAPVPGIRYALLSNIAWRAKKRKCASLLARAEPVTLRRIVQLLKINEPDDALANAVHVRDPNLILFAILYIWPGADSPFKDKTKSAEENLSTDVRQREKMAAERTKFFNIVTKFPIARDILIWYLETAKKIGMLKDLYHLTNQPHRAGNLMVKEAYESSTIEKRMEKMGVAGEMYRNDKASPFYSLICTDQLRLLQAQKDLEALTGKACFIDNSLVDTIFNCLILQLNKKAKQLKDDFKASDKMWYYVKIKALAQLQEWTKLRALSAQKRLPVSFLVFAEACVEAENIEEARYYALLVKDEEERLEAFIKTKSWENAINAAFSAKDITSLQFIHNNCDDTQLQLSIMQKVQTIHQQP